MTCELPGATRETASTCKKNGKSCLIGYCCTGLSCKSSKCKKKWWIKYKILSKMYQLW